MGLVRFGELRGENFGPFAELALPFDSQGVVLVQGRNLDSTGSTSNGSAKTTLISDAPAFCLFGETALGDGPDALLRYEQDEGFVSFEFIPPSGEVFQVERRMRRRKNGRIECSLVLRRDGDDRVSGATMADTQRKIYALLGHDIVSWRNTILCAQGDVDHFAAPGLTDAEQKAPLKRVLRTEQIEGARKENSDDRKALKAKIDALNQELAGARGVLLGMDAGTDAALDGRLLRAQAARNEAAARADIARIAALRQGAKDGRELLETLRASLANRAELEAELRTIERRRATDEANERSALKQIEQLDGELAAAEAEVPRAAGVATDATVKEADARAAAQRAGEAIETARAAVAAASQKAGAAEEALREAERAFERAENKLSLEVTSLVQARGEVALFDEGKCPTCKLPTTVDELHAHVDGLLANVETCKAQVKAAEAHVNETRAQREVALSARNETRGALAKEQAALDRRLRAAQDAIAAGVRAEAAAKAAQAQHKAAVERVATLKRRAAEAQAALGNIRAAAAAREPEAARLRAAVDEMAALVDEERDAREMLAELEGELRDREAAAKRVRELDAELADVKKKIALSKEARALAEKKVAALGLELEEKEYELRHHGFWDTGFSNAGLVSFMLDDVMPDLTAWTNYYLGMLSDGYLSVLFDTQSETKGGSVKEKISTGTTVGGRPLRTSGGQKKRIAIAARVALAEVAAAKAGNALDLFEFDEALDGLDGAGRDRVAVLLQELRKTRSTIYVVSHENFLAELFERTITVEMRNGVARVLR